MKFSLFFLIFFVYEYRLKIHWYLSEMLVPILKSLSKIDVHSVIDTFAGLTGIRSSARILARLKTRQDSEYHSTLYWKWNYYDALVHCSMWCIYSYMYLSNERPTRFQKCSRWLFARCQSNAFHSQSLFNYHCYDYLILYGCIEIEFINWLKAKFHSTLRRSTMHRLWTMMIIIVRLSQRNLDILCSLQMIHYENDPLQMQTEYLIMFRTFQPHQSHLSANLAESVFTPSNWRLNESMFRLNDTMPCCCARLPQNEWMINRWQCNWFFAVHLVVTNGHRFSSLFIRWIANGKQNKSAKRQLYQIWVYLECSVLAYQSLCYKIIINKYIIVINAQLFDSCIHALVTPASISASEKATWCIWWTLWNVSASVCVFLLLAKIDYEWWTHAQRVCAVHTHT